MKKLLIKTIRHLLTIIVLFLHSQLGHTGTILVFGDSLSAGYGLQANEDWPHLLKQKLHAEQYTQYKLINASISGETSRGGLDRFEKTFKKHQPDIVILELGANDGLRGQSLKKMQNHLSQMIQYSLSNNARVILAGMRIPPNYGKRYTETFYQVFQRLNNQHNISLIPFLLDGLMDDKNLIQTDGMHPTAEAQPLLMERVWKTLKPLLQIPKENVTLRNSSIPKQTTSRRG